MNKLYNLFGNRVPTNSHFGNMTNLISQFNQFRQSFQGDPSQEVQKLLNSGQMTQSQYNQLSRMAQMFASLLK